MATTIKDAGANDKQESHKDFLKRISKRKKNPATTDYVEFSPETWTPEQAQMHMATSLDEAFHLASCLAGGWYHRPVVISMRVTANNNEEYLIVPADAPVIALYAAKDGENWQALYEVKRLN